MKVTIKKVHIFLIFAFFSIMLFSNQAFAQDMTYGESSLADTFTEILATNPVFDYTDDDVDYFHVWLRTLFGSFIFEPWTNNAGDISILASAVGFTNLLAVTFGSVVMVYVIGGGALNSTHSGEVLNRNWSPVWMPMRTVLGIGLIIPAPAIGGGVLSIAQLGIIWLVIFGSNAATYLWDNTAHQFVTKGVYGYTPVSAGYRPILDLSKSMVCIDHHVKYERRVNGKLPITAREGETLLGNISYYSGEVVTTEDSRGDDVKTSAIKTKQVWVPVSGSMDAETYNKRIASISPLITDLKSIKGIKSFEFAHRCGGFEIFTEKDVDLNAKEQLDSSDMAISKTIKDAYHKYQVDVLPGALEAAFSIATNLGELSNGNPVKAEQTLKTATDSNDEGEEILKGLDVASSLMLKAGDELMKEVDKKIPGIIHGELSDDQDKQIKRITTGGWAAAGLWFIEVGKVNQVVSSAFNMNNQFTAPTNEKLCLNTVSNAGAASYSFWAKHKEEQRVKFCNDSINNYIATKNLLNETYKKLHSGGRTSTSNAFNLESHLSSCPSADDCVIPETTNVAIMASASQAVLGLLASDFGTGNGNEHNSVDGNMFNPSGFANPFLTLSEIGSTMNNIAVATYAISNMQIALGESAKAPTIDTKVTGWGQIKYFGAQVLKNMGYLTVMIATFLMSSGFVLAYMIPFLPVITWTNMMIGYLITVIEAVTAAPLAVIQMLLPEGQGIVGQRLERAMQLLIVVILKPSLMIIGLVAAITIAGLGFEIFNTYFWIAAKNHSYLNPISFFAVIVIYTSSALTLTTMIVSIMYTLPTHILEWFAGGAGNRGFGEDRVGEAMKSGTQDIKGSIDKLSQNINRERNEKNKQAIKKSDDDKKGSNENADAGGSPAS